MATKKKSPAHTPTPWRTDWLGDERGWILDKDSNYLAEIVAKDECGFVVPLKQQRANAAFIVRACNGHDMLLDAARGFYDLITELQEDGCDLFDDHAPFLGHCYAVLAKY